MIILIQLILKNLKILNKNKDIIIIFYRMHKYFLEKNNLFNIIIIL